MNLQIYWEKPIHIDRGMLSKDPINAIDLGSIPNEPGIYIFARKYGSSYEALYVGKSKTIQSRIKNHLNNYKLINHIKNSRSGGKVLIYGLPITKKGQQLNKVLALLEKALIRHFMLDGNDLVNAQGVKIRSHEITSDWRKTLKTFIPKTMNLEM